LMRTMAMSCRSVNSAKADSIVDTAVSAERIGPSSASPLALTHRAHPPPGSATLAKRDRAEPTGVDYKKVLLAPPIDMPCSSEQEARDGVLSGESVSASSERAQVRRANLVSDGRYERPVFVERCRSHDERCPGRGLEGERNNSVCTVLTLGEADARSPSVSAISSSLGDAAEDKLRS
jgi:hypothetical protein